MALAEKEKLPAFLDNLMAQVGVSCDYFVCLSKVVDIPENFPWENDLRYIVGSKWTYFKHRTEIKASG